MSATRGTQYDCLRTSYSSLELNLRRWADWVRQMLPCVDAKHIVLSLECGTKRLQGDWERRKARFNDCSSMTAAPQTLRDEVT